MFDPNDPHILVDAPFRCGQCGVRPKITFSIQGKCCAKTFCFGLRNCWDGDHGESRCKVASRKYTHQTNYDEYTQQELSDMSRQYIEPWNLSSEAIARLLHLFTNDKVAFDTVLARTRRNDAALAEQALALYNKIYVPHVLSNEAIVTFSSSCSTRSPEEHKRAVKMRGVLGGWNAGGYAPAWIQFDLGRRVNVTKINLIPGQDPSSIVSHHTIYLGTADNMVHQHQLRGVTVSEQEISIDLNVLNIQMVKVYTTPSGSNVRSWVSWHLIEVIGTEVS